MPAKNFRCLEYLNSCSFWFQILADMSDLDTSTIAAIAAVVVAVVALLIAGAQVAQQYVGSGPSLRLCDRYVYGSMPGGGRRVWSWTQFRFRVVYELPQVRLPSAWWKDIDSFDFDFDDGADEQVLPPFYKFPDDPDSQASSSEQRLTKLSLRRQPTFFIHNVSRSIFGGQFRKRQEENGSADTFNLGDYSSEACWFTLARMAQSQCRLRLPYTMILGDADRCPSDLQVVPMLVSTRDIVILCFLLGMSWVGSRVGRSRGNSRLIQMSGACGVLMSSNHPLLGVIVRFVSRPVQADWTPTHITNNKCMAKWIRRACGEYIVGGHSYPYTDLDALRSYLDTKNTKALMFQARGRDVPRDKTRKYRSRGRQRPAMNGGGTFGEASTIRNNWESSNKDDVRLISAGRRCGR